MNVEVVGKARHRGVYLRKTGVIEDVPMIHDRLLEIIYTMFNGGERNKLLLANKAITKLERRRQIHIA